MKIAILLLVLTFQFPLGAAVLYRVVNLEAHGVVESDASYPSAINGLGQVSGSFWTPGETSLEVFLYDDANGFLDIGNLGAYVSRATGLNNLGQIAVNGPVPMGMGSEAFRYQSDSGFLPIGNLGGHESETGGINNHGQVTGYSETADGYEHAYRYTDGLGMQDLGSLFGGHSDGYAINDRGWVTGASDGYNAFLYRDDLGMINLGSGRGYGINNQGIVVGEGGSLGGAVMFREGQAIPLGDGTAYGINNYNQVVGANGSYGFLWTQQTGLVDLNTMIDTNTGWTIGTAVAINDAGQIVGSGHLNDKNIAIRLDPIPPKLDLRFSGKNLLVSWNPPWRGLRLEISPNLSATNWAAVSPTATNCVSLPVTNSVQFYRLTRPLPGP